mgnify:FL=1
MGTLISPLVFTKRDIAGNAFTEVLAIFEYTSAGILPTGESIDLSNFMRRVEMIQAQAISGALLNDPRPNATDFPGNAGSGRMELYTLGSGLVNVNISGLPITILSGHPFLVSGFIGPVSGRLNIGGSGFFNFNTANAQLLSGTAVSGTRAYIRAFGY